MPARPFRLAAAALAAVVNVIPVAAQSPAPLPFDEALALAESRSQRLVAQSAAVQATGELAQRADALPDPKLRLGLDNLLVSGEDAWNWSADPMTMRRIGVMQEVPNGDKRRARGERAVREQEVEQATLVLDRTTVKRDAGMAWYEMLHATRALEVMQDLANAVALQQQTVGAAIAGGKAGTAQGYVVRTAVENVRDQVIDQERVLARARIELARYVGDEARRPVGAAPDTARLAQPVAALVESIDRHPTLQVLDRREALAMSEVALARSTKVPDWSVELLYGQRGPQWGGNMASLLFSVDLPLLTRNRQDRDIAASLAQAERARAMREDARRAYEAQVRTLVVDWETWNRRVERFEKVLIPLARERGESALAAYRGGKGELGGVIEARRAEAETRLGLHNALLERGRAWVGLNFLAAPAETTK